MIFQQNITYRFTLYDYDYEREVDWLSLTIVMEFLNWDQGYYVKVKLLADNATELVDQTVYDHKQYFDHTLDIKPTEEQIEIMGMLAKNAIAKPYCNQMARNIFFGLFVDNPNSKIREFLPKRLIGDK
jgi:hypothetical protein